MKLKFLLIERYKQCSDYYSDVLTINILKKADIFASIHDYDIVYIPQGFQRSIEQQR